MRAYERLVADDGYEVLLFPLEYMYISQDEGGSYSHQGTYNMDFLGWGANGRILNCSYYAPCSCKLVYQSTTGAYNIWESTNKVHTPSGLTYVCFWVMHDDNVERYNVGQVLRQGDLLGKTGTRGQTTGDHLHLNVANSKYVGQEQVPPDNEWQLINSKHIYDMMYVNDTVIVEGLSHTWYTYQGGVTPHSRLKSSFPWVLYARKLREKR